MKVAVLFVAAFSLTAALAVVGPEANLPRTKSVETPEPAHQQQRLHSPQKEVLHAPAVAAEKTDGNQESAEETAAYLDTLLAFYLGTLLTKDVPLPEHYKAHLEAEAKIYKALSRRIDVDFEKKPLRDVVRFFREELDINIQLDEKVLEEWSIDTNEMVTAHAEKITARSALEFVLESLSEPLTWVVQYEMVLVTTLAESDALWITKSYDVTDLVLSRRDDGRLKIDSQQLIDAIAASCDGNAEWWWDDGEGGSIIYVESLGLHGLIVQHTRQVHDDIEIVLAGLRRLRRREPAVFESAPFRSDPEKYLGGTEPVEQADAFLEASPEEIDACLEEFLKRETTLPFQYMAELKTEAKIKKALTRTIALDFEKKPLVEVARFFSEKLDVNEQLDKKALEEASIDSGEPVTAHAKEINARSALEFVLNDLSEPLRWTVKHEMLLITTQEEAEAITQLRFYDVSDLIIKRHDEGKPILDFYGLKEAIKAGCDTSTWWFEDDDEGGSMFPFESLGIHCLIVRQTPEIHDQIENILASLRKMRQKKPSVFENYRANDYGKHSEQPCSKQFLENEGSYFGNSSR